MMKADGASGKYATETELVRDGVRVLRGQDAAIEYAAKSGLGIPASGILERVRAAYRVRLKSGI